MPRRSPRSSTPQPAGRRPARTTHAAPPRNRCSLRFDETFRQRVKICVRRIGGPTRDRVFGRGRRRCASAPIATIRLTGRDPAGAREFTWTYGWTFASYALTVRRAAAEEPVDRMAGRRPEQRAVCVGGAGAARRSARHRPALSRARLHPHRARRTGSRAVRARHLPAERSRARGAVAGQRVHGGALDHARSEHVRHRHRAAEDRRAADRAVDRLRRHREHLPVGAEAVARRAGVRVRAAARHGLRRRAQGARAAALGVRDGAA